MLHGNLTAMLPYSQHAPENAYGAGDTKDRPFKIVVVGYVLPDLILCLMIANLLIGRVFVNARGLSGDTFDGLIQSFPYG